MPEPGNTGNANGITKRALSVAHRGDPVGHRENTLEAFQAACALGADMVELDSRVSRDGEVVVLHDTTLSRLWGDPRQLSDLAWQEVSCIESGGYRVPRLAEVLEAVASPVMVDLPEPAAAVPSWHVAQQVRATERCIFAGSTAGLRQIRQVSPAARIALTWDKRDLPRRELLEEVRPEWWNPYYRLASTSTLEWAHERGMGVSVWTVDGQRDISEILCLGVDAVISNQVARVVEEISRLCRQGANP